MTQPAHRKREWTTPKATRYGSVKELTQQQNKYKDWGGADDVLINNQTLLENAGS